MRSTFSCCGRISRRSFLADCGMGFTGLALGAMLFRDGVARAAAPVGSPHFTPRAKRVIWLFMLGGTSHVESFDPKPALNKYGGKTIGSTPYKNVLTSPRNKDVREFLTDRKLMTTIFPLQIGYRKRGRSGIEVSDWWPHVGACIDDIAVVRSVWTTDNDHAAQYQFHTGRHVFDGSHPALGAWVHYGLGSLNENLPQFIALGQPPGSCCGGVGAQSGSYLGPEHSAVPLQVGGKAPLAYAALATGMSREEQEREFELLGELNGLTAAKYPDDNTMRARIKSYELAFRMQRTVPELLNVEKENEATRKLYGMDNPITKPFGQVCLTARRLAESGVRFVQVYHGDGVGSLWDAHANLKDNHTRLCAQVDQPIAGLLRDLKQRGMLDDTLVVWATEFGRTPGAENSNGRDHHPYGFSVWLAGGGIKGGMAHGATDELGFHAIESRHYVTDIHATVLHQLGLDSRKLEVPGQKRLEIDHGRVIREIVV